MVAPKNTLRLLLASVGVNDVIQFLGATNAQKVAIDMFDDDFLSCMDKSYEKIEAGIKSYSMLTFVQGQICL